MPSRPIIGVLSSCVSQTFTKVKLPVPVDIDLGRVGGPSAGLAFALDVVEELGHDVDRGLQGGGVRRDLRGRDRRARRRPETEDDRRQACRDRRLPRPGWGKRSRGARYAGGMRIIPVHSFRQALHALATLPRKAAESLNFSTGSFLPEIAQFSSLATLARRSCAL